MHHGELSCLSALSDVMLLLTRMISAAVVAGAPGAWRNHLRLATPGLFFFPRHAVRVLGETQKILVH